MGWKPFSLQELTIKDQVPIEGKTAQIYATI